MNARYLIDRVDFPAFVAELMKGVFEANVDVSLFTHSFHYASDSGPKQVTVLTAQNDLGCVESSEKVFCAQQ